MSRRSKPLSTSGVHTVQYGWGHITPHLPPWIAWLSLPVLALLARHFSTGSIQAAMAAAMGMLVVIAGLTFFTWHVFHARGHSICVHASTSVGAAGLWLLIALVAGLRVPIVWWLWALGGIGVCAAWTLRRVARGEGKDTHDNDGGRELTAAIGLPGARIARPKTIGPKVSAPLQLVGGEQTTKDAQGAKSRLESKLGLRPGAVRIIGNPEDESRPTIEIVARDPLKGKIDWKGPNAPGQSITEVIEFATYDDGRRAGLWLPGQEKPQPRNAAHYKVAGVTGAGKTEGGLIVDTNIMTRPDASLIYLDSVKGIQSIAPIVNGVDLPIIDRPTVLKFMKKLQPLIRARTDWLGRNGFKQWVPGCGLKLLVIDFQESADILADSTTFTKHSEQARSAGLIFVVSQQRWTHDRIDTSARANFAGAICYGVDNQDSAEAVLPDEMIDAGAAPWRWGANEPGKLYLMGPGIDRALWPVPARSDYADPDHLTEVVAEWASPGLDEVTAAVLGDLYSDHVSLVAEGKAPWQKPMVTATKMRAPAAAVEPVDEAVDDEDEESDYEHEVPAQPEPGFMDDINPEQDIPEDEDPIMAIGVTMPQIRPGRSEAVAALEAELKARAAAGGSTIAPKDLVEFRQQIGRSAAWLSGELSRLVEEGLLSEEPDRGVYGLPVPVAA